MLDFTPEGNEYRPQSIVQIRSIVVEGITSMLDFSEALQKDASLQASELLIGFDTNPIMAQFAKTRLGFQSIEDEDWKPVFPCDLEKESIATTPTSLLGYTPYLLSLKDKYRIH